ncbi:MAG: hypothetical protein N3E37_05810 [Candidatus Micrarchaeota archaeon]|nr:hypothetical protein [Candidatus Micrarchaeota archaeon]
MIVYFFLVILFFLPKDALCQEKFKPFELDVIKPIRVVEPISPEAETEKNAEQPSPKTEENIQTEHKEEKSQNETKQERHEQKPIKVDPAVHIEKMKFFADTRWFKVKYNKNEYEISGMTKSSETKEKIKQYCKENKIKCKISLVKIM